jgi:ABC-2 type transport system permease protein
MFRTLLGKEFREQWRTWKMVIFLIVFLIIGCVSPVLAKYTPVLLRSIPEMAEFADHIPEPTINDAIAQYIKNAVQFGILLVVLLTMGIVAQEKERGTAAMLFTKPVSRSAVVLAKWLAGITTLTLGLVLGGICCLVYTAILFEPLPVGKFLILSLFLLISLGVYLSITLLASALSRTQAMAAAGAFGGMAVLLVLSAIPRVSDYTPGKLDSWGASLLTGGGKAAWPALVVSLALIILAVTVACLHLERQEI